MKKIRDFLRWILNPGGELKPQEVKVRCRL
jgi:hypothetical protein